MNGWQTSVVTAEVINFNSSILSRLLKKIITLSFSEHSLTH